MKVQHVEHPARRTALVFTHPNLGDGIFTDAIRKALAEYHQWLDGAVPYSRDPEFQRADTDDFTASNGILIQVYPLQHWDEPVAGLSFGQAIAAMKKGKRVARAGWNGKGMWLVLVPGTPSAQLKPGTPYANALGLESCEILPHIDMWTVNASGRRAMLPGWLASQTDMLADDWMILD